MDLMRTHVLSFPSYRMLIRALAYLTEQLSVLLRPLKLGRAILPEVLSLDWFQLFSNVLPVVELYQILHWTQVTKIGWSTLHNHLQDLQALYLYSNIDFRFPAVQL